MSPGTLVGETPRQGVHPTRPRVAHCTVLLRRYLGTQLPVGARRHVVTSSITLWHRVELIQHTLCHILTCSEAVCNRLRGNVLHGWADPIASVEYSDLLGDGIQGGARRIRNVQGVSENANSVLCLHVLDDPLVHWLQMWRCVGREEDQLDVSELGVLWMRRCIIQKQHLLVECL